MLGWTMVAMLLFFFLAGLRGADEHKLVVAVCFKALLVVLGGIAGYWRDRALFPYARPHQCQGFDMPEPGPGDGSSSRSIPPDGEDLNQAREYEVHGAAYLQVAASDFTTSMIRRSIIVAACVLAMALGGGGLSPLAGG